jgi:hypothetical protein
MIQAPYVAAVKDLHSQEQLGGGEQRPSNLDMDVVCNFLAFSQGQADQLSQSL